MLERLKALMQEEILQTTRSDVPQDVSERAVVARQPVFDTSGKIWGYELLYRRIQTAETANFASGAVATASVIINGFEMVRPGIKNSQKILINFTADMLETQAIKLLPRDMCIVEILEDVEPTPEIIEAVKEIKEAGYGIAVDDYVGQEHLRLFLDFADIVKIDVLGLSEQELRDYVERTSGRGITLLAEKVETREMADLCRRLGFKLFQGFFFSKPEIIKGKKVTTSQAVRMHILAMCVGEDVNLHAVSEAMLHDPVITSNFLRFVNSAHFGLRNIRSVHQALAYVGSLTFIKWLCVSVLATLENTPISHELAFLASQRARFLEGLGKTLEGRGKLPQGVTTTALFLTGLFSLLENLMGVPLSVALEGVPLEPEVLTALTGGTSVYTPWYSLMNHYERGEWHACIPIAATLDLSESEMAEAYGKALKWNAAFFGDGEHSAGKNGF